MSPVSAPSITPEGLFSARLAADAAAPLVTFYDDATGERAELSARSLANWVAKTHFLLVDELGLGVGDRAVIALPVHWLAFPVLLGCWFAGLEVAAAVEATVAAGDRTATVAAGDRTATLAPGDRTATLAPGDRTATLAPGERTGRPAVAFGTAAALARPELAAADARYAVSLRSMARPAEAPPGAEDYATAVRPMPDVWSTVHPAATSADPALPGVSRSELAAAATRRAAQLGLGPGGRLLWTAPWASADDWTGALLAPLAAGGSVVLVRHPDSAGLTARAAAEKATVVL